MEKLTRRSFIAGTAAASAALTAAAPAFADEAADGRTVETAVTNPTNGTLAAGYLNYFDWLGNKPSYAEGDVVSTVEADVVVIGGGNAGVCAALAALHAPVPRVPNIVHTVPPYRRVRSRKTCSALSARFSAAVSGRMASSNVVTPRTAGKNAVMPALLHASALFSIPPANAMTGL